MKKLLLHIGYPKTATTTLQEEIFVTLHNQGKINYLGRTTKSTHSRSGQSNFNGTDWVWHIRQHFINGKPLKHDYSLLKPNIPNVISDENLTFHDFFHFAQFGKSYNHNTFPQRLKNLLGTDVEVEIILTLRNQIDLIFSSYLQKLKHIKHYIGDYSFTDFLKNECAYNKRNVESHLQLYNFNYITNLWQSEFLNKINILFFEDMVNDKETFFSEFSKIIPASLSELIELSSNKHHRKKDKTNNYFLSSYRSLSKFSRLITIFVNRSKFERFLERRYHMRFSILIKCEQKLVYKIITFKVPKPTEEEQKFIMDMFSKSNLEFAKARSIDINKMIKYNYTN